MSTVEARYRGTMARAVGRGAVGSMCAGDLAAWDRLADEAAELCRLARLEVHECALKSAAAPSPA